jgi:hypothetical protein
MANTFLRKTQNNIATTFTSVYTVPNNTSAVVIGGIVANTGNSSVTGEITINDGTNDINLTGANTPIPAGTSLSFIDGKIVMQAGDILKARGSVANQIDVYLSIMEIS